MLLFKDKDFIEKRTSEILGKSFLNEYLQDEGVTDINFDGVKLSIKHNKKGSINLENHEHPSIEAVRNLIKQIADIQGKEFTVSNPILDTEIGFLRLNAMHETISPDGMTFSFRVSRPRLAVSSIADSIMSNNEAICSSIEELLSVLIKSKCNIIISGATGSGKTELQKLLVGYIDDKQQIFLIEDTRDSHIKSLYPEKNIKSTQVLMSDERERKITQQVLVKSGLRNLPNWLIVSETRGAEAADMLDAVKTNHSLITTLHASGAMNIPSRLMSMIRQGGSYANMSDTLIARELIEFLPIGVHLDVKEVKGVGVIRGIKEIVEFTGFDDVYGAQGNYLYRQANKYNRQTKEYMLWEETNPLTERLLSKVEDAKLYHLLPGIYMPKTDERMVLTQ